MDYSDIDPEMAVLMHQARHLTEKQKIEHDRRVAIEEARMLHEQAIKEQRDSYWSAIEELAEVLSKVISFGERDKLSLETQAVLAMADGEALARLADQGSGATMSQVKRFPYLLRKFPNI